RRLGRPPGEAEEPNALEVRSLKSACDVSRSTPPCRRGPATARKGEVMRKHSLMVRLRRAVVISGVVGAATIGVAAAPALAAKPAPAPAQSSITLTTANPTFGGGASFNIVDPPAKSVQEISVTCSQNGQPV